jgi:hypothetical protein
MDEESWDEEKLRLRCLEAVEAIRRQLGQPVECFEMEDWEDGVATGPAPTWDPPVEDEPEEEDDLERLDEDGNPMRRSEDESGAGGGW